jgi:shikimate kinase
MNKSNKNIVLIGMPGCGKTLIGRLLSEKLNMEFIDLDMHIEKSSGLTISEIFKQGEESFRRLETQAISELVKSSYTIISTGGGVIKKNINIEMLKKLGLIIFIDRPIENIAADIKLKSRPLLKDGIQNLYRIYNERYEQYKKSSDITINNDSSMENVLEQIIRTYIIFRE